MANNVTIDNGTLTDYDVLTDDVGGKNCQIVKLSFDADGSGTAATSVPVTGSVTANAGTNLNTSALALESGGNLASIKTNTAPLVTAQGAATSGKTGPLVLTSTTTANPTYTNGTVNPLSTDTAGLLRTIVSSWGTNISVNNGVAGSATIRVTLASDSTGQVKEVRSGTGTVSSVNDTATSATLLAGNTSRLGATIFNDSTAALYVLFASGTASSTNYSVKVLTNGLVTVPANYTGIIVGVWATDPNDGGARITEFTA